MNATTSTTDNNPLIKSLGRVGVLFGGTSAEREVSLKSGHAVSAALRDAGVDVVELDLNENAIDQIRAARIDRAFIALHGVGGEDGRMQALLEFLQIPYTGSGVQSSSIAMDKLKTKLLWCGVNLPTPEFTVLSEAADWAQVLTDLGGDVMVKPAHEGSSIGMSRVDSPENLAAAYQKAAQYDSVVFAERVIVGAEYTVAVLNGRALAPIKLETDHHFYDFDAKYVTGDTRYLCPCGLDQTQEQKLQKLAVQAFDHLGCDTWGRVDFMADAQGEYYLLEANTVPGMTETSLVPKAAAACGIGFQELVLDILAATLSAEQSTTL